MASVIAQVEYPRRALSWAGAAGVTRRVDGVEVDSETAFRVASVAKMFIATAIFRLSEQGQLSIDESVTKYLSTDTSELLRARGYAVDSIKVEHLLAHTSGIPDFDSVDFVNAITTDPDRRWTRREQLTYGLDRNPKTGEPGSGPNYSNNGFNLLGEIIEERTGLGLAAALRQLIGYDRLGMKSTWLEADEPAPAGVRLAHAYDETGFDLQRINPSADAFGAGGLVSTVGDLNRFIRALLEGRIISGESLRIMQSGPRDGHGRGLFNLPLGPTTCWGHEGFWGSVAYYCEASGLSLTLSINFAFMTENRTADPELRSSTLAAQLVEIASR